MNLVLDANILFAALIKNNVTRKILVSEDARLYAPEFIFVELEKYSDYICKKSGQSHEELEKVLAVFIRRITVFSGKDLDLYVSYAERISPDPNDVPYFALALKLNCPIWSNDKKLKEQKEIIVYSTDDLLRFHLSLS